MAKYLENNKYVKNKRNYTANQLSTIHFQDSVEDIEEIKPPKLIESKSILKVIYQLQMIANFFKKNMKSLRSKSEDSELFDEVCHSLTFDYHWLLKRFAKLYI